MKTLTHEQLMHGGAHAAPPARQSRFRDRASCWRYTRHLGEMVIAMLIGMAVLGLATAAFGNLPGSSDRLIQYAWMGLAMTVPMVAWMRRMGHTRADGVEMTMAMLVPMFANDSSAGIGAPTAELTGLTGLDAREIEARLGACRGEGGNMLRWRPSPAGTP